MKLELKHLAPYLPYDLKLCDGVRIRQMCINYGNKNRATDYGLDQVLQHQDMKPILRLLSDLKKITKEEYNKIYNDFGVIPSHLWSYDKITTRSWLNHYDLIEYLISQHYDVFELIKEGLAIDINTLNQ